jgi:hypothetical protein
MFHHHENQPFVLVVLDRHSVALSAVATTTWLFQMLLHVVTIAVTQLVNQEVGMAH